MPIYEINSERIVKIDETSFEQMGLQERNDLQKLLRNQIEVIAPDTLVIAEEFGEWEESRRRIDLLCLDKEANLVVVELKRTEDGGHMELQAIRYAAMVSTMTFDKAVEAYSDYLGKIGRDDDARESILHFLKWDEPDEDVFAQDVRILLVSADFGKELTTAVMWLNDRDLDIRCIRIKPYNDNGRTLVDVQQVIPLPEAEEYQVQIREKAARERSSRRGKSESEQLCYRFWKGLLERARPKTNLHSNISPSYRTYLGSPAGKAFLYAFGRNSYHVGLYIDTGDKENNKKIFDELFASKAEIEKAFGKPLGWERLDEKRACRIRYELGEGYLREETRWPEFKDRMIDAMIRFERALRPYLSKLEE